MVTASASPAIISQTDFFYSQFDWGKVAEPVGPEMGANEIKVNVVDIFPGKVWNLGWSVEEENVAVIFRGWGFGDVAGSRNELTRSSALYSPTGRTLELCAGEEGMVAYIWRTKLRGDEPRGDQPRVSSRLDHTETQLRDFSGTGEVAADDNTAVMNFVFWPGTGSSKLCLHCGIMDPGETFNVHIHPESEEAFIGFFGSGQFYLDYDWYDAGPGDVLFAPPGVSHGTRLPASGFGDQFITCGGPVPFDRALYDRAGVPADVK